MGGALRPGFPSYRHPGHQRQDLDQFLPGIEIAVETAEDQGIEDIQAVLVIGQQGGLALGDIRGDDPRQFRLVEGGPQMAGPAR